MSWLKMRDEWTVRLEDLHKYNPHLLSLKDGAKSAQGLLVYTAATHAGIVNGNYRFYRPDLMMDSAHTWVPAKAYPRPVLIGHDEDGEVLGRVLKSRFVDTSHQYLGDFPIIKDASFYRNGADKRMGLYETVDWIVDNLQGMDDYTGLGYIELGMNITNPAAIEKVLRDEYLTVSVGFKTDSAVCSICHTDWAREDRCAHKMGEDVDGKQMFLISGNFDYEEVSFVNFPADPFATNISKEVMADSLKKIFFLGLPIQQQRQLKGVRMSDSLYSADIQFEEPMAKTIVDVKTIDTATFSAEIRGEKLTSERAQELKTQLQAWSPEKEEDKTAKRSLVSTLNAKIRKNNWDKPATEATASETDAAITENTQDAAVECECESRPTNGEPCACYSGDPGQWDDLTEEEKEFFSDTDGLYAEMEIEIDEAVKAGELSADSVKDAKLSSEKRNGLKGSTFCGPNRSFPVPDCAHVTAARRLIGRAKVGESTKSKILACVSRKASSLSCGGAKKDAAQAIDSLATIATKFFDAAEVSKEGTSPGDVVKHYDGIHSIFHKADDDLQGKILGLHYSLGEHWSTKRNVGWYKGRLLGKDEIQKVLDEADEPGKQSIKDSILAVATEWNPTLKTVTDTDTVISKQDLAEKEESLNSLTDENTKLKEVQKQLLDAHKRSLATQVVMFRTLSGEAEYKDLSADDRKKKVDELAKRHVQSLKDSVSDIMNSLKWAEPTEATRKDKVSEPGRTVNDNAQVTDSGAATDNTATVPQPTQEEVEATQRFLDSLQFMTSKERTQYLLSRQYAGITSAQS